MIGCRPITGIQIHLRYLSPIIHGRGHVLNMKSDDLCSHFESWGIVTLLNSLSKLTTHHCNQLQTFHALHPFVPMVNGFPCDVSISV